MLGVQPRIRLMRSFDQSSHTYQGYVLRLHGELAGVERAVIVALGKAAHEKHEFRVGDVVSGAGELASDAETEVADVYKASGLRVVERATVEPIEPPPWLGVPPPLGEPYRGPLTETDEREAVELPARNEPHLSQRGERRVVLALLAVTVVVLCLVAFVATFRPEAR